MDTFFEVYKVCGRRVIDGKWQELSEEIVPTKRMVKKRIWLRERNVATFDFDDAKQKAVNIARGFIENEAFQDIAVVGYWYDSDSSWWMSSGERRIWLNGRWV